MTTPGDEFSTSCCGICCVACTGALESWGFTNSCGSGGGGKQAGCCGSCCNKSFDEDDFQSKNGRGAEGVSEQPTPHSPMSDKPSPVST